MATKKTGQQLLKLSNNPFFQLSDAEQKDLEAFLSSEQGKEYVKSLKKNEKESSENVRVRNVVKKADTDVPEATKNES